MKNYWSCTKFADWIRGTPKPPSATTEGWSNWEKTAKVKSFRYWLAEEGLEYLQNFLFWPVNRIKAIRFYVNNRWVTKSHTLTSNLKKGSWYDFDTRLLHSLFDELINVVEIEFAWKNALSSKEEQKKYKTPLYRALFRINNWRCPEAGIDYLNWASQLIFDETMVTTDNPDFGKPTSQAHAAQEILVLYRWWKEDRPKRPSPSDASGLTAYNEKNPNNKDIFSMKKDNFPRSIMDNYHKIEEQYDTEDTAMLIRLIKIRHHLWT